MHFVRSHLLLVLQIVDGGMQLIILLLGSIGNFGLDFR